MTVAPASDPATLPGTPALGPEAPGRRSPAARVLRGPPEDPPWARPGLLILLGATAGLYLWDLGAQGWANAFYSAAVQAGTKSWKAFFFGSFDSSNFITVDKPPASLWVMELSARIFGLNSWSILVPQAIEGVATVGILYATLRRRFSPAAGLIAGAVLALTPVAALMFRYNNPDALLALVVVGALYATVRVLERAQTRWLVLAGSLLGLGFITKLLQALLVAPVIGVVYLFAGPPRLGRRIAQLGWGALAFFVSAGWWVAAVELTPAADRPYVGGSQDNSLFNVIFGYNGFGRLTGNEAGSVGGAPAGSSIWGPTGWTRMFNSTFGTQASWLIPAALVALVGILWVTRRAPRGDRTRAAALLWGATLVVTMAVFSFAQGIIHPYYTVALAPATGALVGLGAVVLWERRGSWFARGALCGAIGLSAWWADALLGRTPQWNGWLRGLIGTVGALGAIGVLAAPVLGWAKRAVVGMALAAALAAPLAFSIDAAATPASGAIPTAGPSPAAGRGGPGPGRFASGPPRGGHLGGRLGPRPGAPGPAGRPGGTPPGHPRSRTRGAPGPAPSARGAPGGLLNAPRAGAALVGLLRRGADRYSWVAATVGANEAAGYQLGTDDPVMAIGGFNGTDPAPSLAAFERLVAEGRIHYFIVGGGVGGAFARLGGIFSGGLPRASSTSGDAAAISSWVQSHYRAMTVDGVTLYDLRPPGA